MQIKIINRKFSVNFFTCIAKYKTGIFFKEIQCFVLIWPKANLAIVKKKLAQHGLISEEVLYN